jgi:hypothetical protein
MQIASIAADRIRRSIAEIFGLSCAVSKARSTTMTADRILVAWLPIAMIFGSFAVLGRLGEGSCRGDKTN